MEIVKEKINKEYKDWNFDTHRVIDTTPTDEDFMKTVASFLEFERKKSLVKGFKEQGYSDDFLSFIWKM